MSDMLKKFDRYCYEFKDLIKYEDFHSPKLAKCRKKLRKMLITISSEKTCDIGEKLENYWKLAYYLPISRLLKRSESLMETSTLITVFCGELQELLAVLPSKYSSQLNLYLGDLHRYMSDKSAQSDLSATYYCRAIELDSNQGRAFNMLAILKPDNYSNIQLLRLYLMSLLAEKSYNSENNIKSLVTDIMLDDSETDDKFYFEFFEWCIFSSISHSETELFSKFQHTIENPEKQSELAEIVSTVTPIIRYAIQKGPDSRFIYLFENFLNIFKTLPKTNNLILISILEWIFWISSLLGGPSGGDETKKLSDVVPMFLKTKWEEFCDSICDFLNQNCDLTPILEQKLDFEQIRVSYLINGPKERKFPTFQELFAFWCHEICSLENSPFEINRDGHPMVQRVNKKNHRKIDLPVSEQISPKISDESEDSSWKPIYVVVDLQSIVENFSNIVQIWRNTDFISAISSDVLAKLDKQKNSSSSNVRWALREIHERQKMGKMRIVTAENVHDCCRQLVDSASKMPFTNHEQIVALLVHSKTDYNTPDTKGVTIYEADEFQQKCNV